MQELLAPKNMEFFGSDGRRIGTRSELLGDIEAATKMSKSCFEDFRRASVAERLRWASARKTTRVEDCAYSLMGLFGVSMDMRYGEEEMAFRRLQEAIIGRSADDSIFAWESDDAKLSRSGVLAPRLECFNNCGSMSLVRSINNAYSKSLDRNAPKTSTARF